MEKSTPVTNKYYLREDRTAVKPEIREPTGKEHRKNCLCPTCLYFLDHITSLPALTVDPAYLETLKPGLFEGVERYEVIGKEGTWVEVIKYWYDNHGLNPRRLTIIAPQEAEKGQDVINRRIESIHEALALIIGKADQGFYDEAAPHEMLFEILSISKQAYALVNTRATPQPVTGEAVDAAMNYCEQHRSKYPEATEDYLIGLRDGYIAASRPSASEEQREGWVSGVPKITDECVFVTATRHKDHWDYSVWEAKIIEGVNEKDEGAYYLALLDGDGEEWGPLDELVADKTFILPKLPTPPTK